MRTMRQKMMPIGISRLARPTLASSRSSAGCASTPLPASSTCSSPAIVTVRAKARSPKPAANAITQKKVARKTETVKSTTGTTSEAPSPAVSRIQRASRMPPIAQSETIRMEVARSMF